MLNRKNPYYWKNFVLERKTSDAILTIGNIKQIWIADMGHLSFIFVSALSARLRRLWDEGKQMRLKIQFGL